MFGLEQLEVGEIATAPADRTDYEHRWLIDPRTGRLDFWTFDAGGSDLELPEARAAWG